MDNVLKGLESTLKLFYVFPQVSTFLSKLLFPWVRGEESILSGNQGHETFCWGILGRFKCRQRKNVLFLYLILNLFSILVIPIQRCCLPQDQRSICPGWRWHFWRSKCQGEQWSCEEGWEEVPFWEVFPSNCKNLSEYLVISVSTEVMAAHHNYRQACHFPLHDWPGREERAFIKERPSSTLGEATVVDRLHRFFRQTKGGRTRQPEICLLKSCHL